MGQIIKFTAVSTNSDSVRFVQAFEQRSHLLRSIYNCVRGFRAPLSPLKKENALRHLRVPDYVVKRLYYLLQRCSPRSACHICEYD